jgi:hypothetical protein
MTSGTGGRRIALQDAGELQPVESWQHEIEHDQRRRMSADGVEGGVAARLHVDLVAGLLEVEAQHLREIGLVLDDADQGPCHGVGKI